MKDINFIQPIPPKKQEAIMLWLRISGIGALVLSIFFACFTLYKAYSVFTLHKKKKTLQSVQTQLRTIKERSCYYEKQEALLQKKIDKVTHFNEDPKHAIAILNELSERIPSDVALLHYKQVKHSLELEGLAIQTPRILTFLHDLNQSPLFSQMVITSLQQENAHALSSYIRFTLKGKLKKTKN